MTNEDAILEVVVRLSGDSLSHTNIASANDGNASKSNGNDAATETPTAPTFCEDTAWPSVSVSSTGHAFAIIKEANVGRSEEDGGRLDLTLPQQIVPESAKSYFWDGDLTIRAVLAAQ